MRKYGILPIDLDNNCKRLILSFVRLSQYFIYLGRRLYLVHKIYHRSALKHYRHCMSSIYCSCRKDIISYDKGMT